MVSFHMYLEHLVACKHPLLQRLAETGCMHTWPVGAVARTALGTGIRLGCICGIENMGSWRMQNLLGRRCRRRCRGDRLARGEGWRSPLPVPYAIRAVGTWLICQVGNGVVVSSSRLLPLQGILEITGNGFGNCTHGLLGLKRKFLPRRFGICTRRCGRSSG